MPGPRASSHVGIQPRSCCAEVSRQGRHRCEGLNEAHAAALPRLDAGVGRQTMTSAEHRISLHQAQELPAVVDVVTAADVLGIGRTAAYGLIRTEAWPTPGCD